MESQTGITIISLIVTIIVLLILAGISISTLTSENGIIKQSKSAKEETEISEEKEAIQKAIVNAIGENKRGDIEKDEFQNQLDKEVGNKKMEVSDIGDGFEVDVKDTNRYYVIDKDGTIKDTKEIIIDPYPGDITKGKDGETLDGSEEHPYEIWCIEDLVAFSNMVNGTGIKFENEKPVEITSPYNFIYCYVELKQDLNFKSKMSYADSQRTDFGDINGITDDGNTLINEMTTGAGFHPIGDISANDGFAGSFEGNNKKIQELYVNCENFAGLFGQASRLKSIKNLEISGNITVKEGSNNSAAGGFVAQVSTQLGDTMIENCINNANVNGIEAAGGMVGYKRSSVKRLNISNCKNNGKISGNNCVGGIVGLGYTTTNVINCYNTGDISGGSNSGYSGVGGIVGLSMFTPKTINSYNTGNITSIKNAGGITGYLHWSEAYIENCYNIGKIQGNVIGGILGGATISNELFTIKNAYFLNSTADKGMGGGPSEKNEFVKAVSEQEMKSESLLNIFNTYVDENPQKEEVDLLKWKKGENGYLEFDS